MLGSRRRTIDDTYAEMLAELPTELRAEGRDLPHRLGLAGPLGSWEDFILMAPNRDLPRYAAEDPRRPGQQLLAEDAVDSYLRAHHYAGIFGLIADRLADGQVPRSRGLVRLRDRALESWTLTLSVATGSPHRARALVASALRSLRWGNAQERLALARAKKHGSGTLSTSKYVALTCAKLRWFGTGAHAMLLTLGDRRRAQALQLAYDLFSVSLQLIDDAIDDEPDRIQRGMSFPDALGAPPGALLATAPKLAGSAARIALRAGFRDLGQWLSHFTRTIDGWAIPGDPLKNAFGAHKLLGAMEELLDG
ncbi:MAG: hypothetical protein R3B70_23195 [Polyangiaceae bacterium]